MAVPLMIKSFSFSGIDSGIGNTSTSDEVAVELLSVTFSEL